MNDAAVDWRPEMRELIWALTECARRSRVGEVEQVLALGMAAQMVEVFARKLGPGCGEVEQAMARLGQVAFDFVKTARRAGVGVVSIHGNSNQFNTSEV